MLRADSGGERVGWIRRRAGNRLYEERRERAPYRSQPFVVPEEVTAGVGRGELVEWTREVCLTPGRSTVGGAAAVLAVRVGKQSVLVDMTKKTIFRFANGKRARFSDVTLDDTIDIAVSRTPDCARSRWRPG